jgi:hypothetical protein
MEENYAPSQNDSKKEPKDFVTRLSHKIQKTIGLTSNKPDILLDNQILSQINLKPESSLPTTITILNNNGATQITNLIRSEKMSNLFEEKVTPLQKNKQDSDSDSDSEIYFQGIQVAQSIGCPGPTGPFTNTFIYLNRDTEQILAKKTAIQWTSNPIKVGDIANITNTSEIFIWKSGFYIVCYNVCSLQSYKFSLFKNGDIVSGSTINYIAGFTQNSARVVMFVNKSDMSYPTSVSPTGFAAKIEVVNHTPTIPHVRIMNLDTTDTAPQLVSTISISLLSEI